MKKNLGLEDNATHEGQVRWNRILTPFLMLGVLNGLPSCVTGDHQPTSKTQDVLVRDFEDIEFVHDGKSYLFQLQNQRFVNMMHGVILWIPEAEVLIPVGELGGPMYQELEPVLVASHPFRITDGHMGIEDTGETSINRSDVWNWIKSEFPGAQPGPTKTFEQLRESIRSRGKHHP